MDEKISEMAASIAKKQGKYLDECLKNLLRRNGINPKTTREELNSKGFELIMEDIRDTSSCGIIKFKGVYKLCKLIDTQCYNFECKLVIEDDE